MNLYRASVVTCCLVALVLLLAGVGSITAITYRAVKDIKPCPDLITPLVDNEQAILLKIIILVPKIELALAKNIAKVLGEMPCVDANLVLAMIFHESYFRPEAVSPKGAIGLMQVLEQWLDFMHFPGPATDIYTNIKCGVGVLNIYHDWFKNLRLALVAYNRGPNPVHTAIVNGKEPDNGYAERVLKLKEKLESYDL